MNLRHTKTIKKLISKKRTEAGATFVKTKSSGAGAMFMKRRAVKPEL